jgi:hypothetical protein
MNPRNPFVWVTVNPKEEFEIIEWYGIFCNSVIDEVENMLNDHLWTMTYGEDICAAEFMVDLEALTYVETGRYQFFIDEE